MKRDPASTSDEDEPGHRGRPRNPEPSSSVSTWLAARDHDKLCQLASRHDLSISALVRTLLKSRLR